MTEKEEGREGKGREEIRVGKVRSREALKLGV